MAKFVLLFQDNVGAAAPTEEEYRAILKDFGDWARKLRAEGRLLGGHKLTDEPGRSMKKKDSAVLVMDGPFAETKEMISGLMVIEAEDYDSAVDLARSCPQLKYGGRIEVRQIDELDH